jgi:hypothetical protein
LSQASTKKLSIRKGSGARESLKMAPKAKTAARQQFKVPGG